MTRFTVALLALLALLWAVSPSAAQERRASLPDIEDEVMCVTCNVPLFIAESPQASRQREFIRGLIAQGLTKEQIKARLVDEYGENVLALPKQEGVGIAAYAVPIVTLAVLVGVLALLLPRWRRTGRARASGGRAVAAGGPAATDAELHRLDEDLRRGG